MAKYLTRQRKRLLAYLSEHTDEQMTARQIADALAADNSSSAVKVNSAGNHFLRVESAINTTVWLLGWKKDKRT